VASTIDSPRGGTFMGSIQIDPERMEIKVGIFRLRHAAWLQNRVLGFKPAALRRNPAVLQCSV